MIEQIFGAAAMTFGFLTFLVGLTAQVVKQHREKRCGISVVFVSLGTITCVVRMTYFALSGAWWTIPPDVLGLALSVIILYQYGAYERHWWGKLKKS